MKRVAINGFGRIGRNFLRASLERTPGYEVVAVNDLGDPRTIAHLLQFDSLLGPLGEDVRADDDSIAVGGRRLQALSIPDPAALPWRELEIDVVVESTGRFEQRAKAQAHLAAGARSVVISAVAADADATLVLGVNDGAYDPERHRIVSTASCTTNCVTPLAKRLLDAFGIERGFMTTIHAYTQDQMLQDGPHKDLRRARAAAINLVPTSTGAARAIGLVLPHLKGKVDGMSMRAPVPTGSVTDLVVELRQAASVEQVNEAFQAAASAGPLEPYLEYSSDPLVSSDIVHSPASCTFDSELTMATGNSAKIFGWYDNEWGYSCRLVDLVSKVL
jgi:glyceraldehyde 3-phosphate dehydrogenase